MRTRSDKTRRLTAAIAWCAVVASALDAASASATSVDAAKFGPVGRVTLSAGPVYGYVVLDSAEPSGAGASLAVGYGLTDALTLRGTALWTSHRLEPTPDRAGGALHMVNASFAVAYALDLLDFTPMIEAGLGLLHRRFEGAAATDLGIVLAIGAHFWIVDWLGLGGRLCLHALVTNLAAFPVFVEMGPSVAVRW